MFRLKVLLTSLLFVFALVISGCGSDNSDTPVASGGTGTTTGTIPDITDVSDVSDLNASLITVLLPVSLKTVTLNSEQISIEVKVFDGANNPYSDGEIKIVFPNDVRDGRDIGSFQDLNASLTNGLATFYYTAPKKLSDNTNNIVFGFYHSANPSEVKQYTISIEPEANQTTLTTYSIKSSLVSGSLTMGLESDKIVSFYVVDDFGTQLEATSITSITMTLSNTALADIEYKGTIYPTTVTMNDDDKNSLSVNIESFTKSGIIPIDVSATFINADGNSETITGIFNLIILSGPPTAMSIAYEGTSHDEDNAKFQEKMVITVTDKYFNRVNTNPAVTVAMITGYAQETAGNTKAALDSRIFFETTDAKAATMNPSSNAVAPNTLTSTANFSNVDLANDILLTYGNGYTNSVSGKWDMNAIGVNEITLDDTIPGASNVPNIGFVIGHNYRQDTCRDGQEWVGYVELESDTLDDNGIAKAIINYDYYLTGKTIALGVDLVGYTADTNTTSKFGEMRKHTLRSTGMTAVPASYSIPKSTIGATMTFSFEIDDTGEWLRNANPGYTIIFNDNTYNISSVNTTTISECVGGGTDGGVVYVTVTASTTGDGAGSIALERITVGNEF